MDIESLKGVGAKTALLLRSLNINTVKDLIDFYPRSYENFSNPTTIQSAKGRKISCVKIKVISKFFPSMLKSGRFIYRLAASDGTDGLEIIFFNSKYSYEKLKIGNEYVLLGAVTVNNGKYQMLSPKIKESGQDLVPVYSLCKGLTSKKIASLVKNAFDLVPKNYPIDIFPEKILKEKDLCKISFAVRNIHFPSDLESLHAVRRRLIFEEFFFYHLSMKSLKKQARQKSKVIIKNDYSEEFYAKLPFKITDEQRKVVSECLKDMQGLSMNRLLQGDVGSGKTVTAAAIAYSVVKNGYQVAFMAPTELLATQHFETLKDFFKGLNIKTELICGSMRAKAKRDAYENAALGIADVVVGTHAIISDNLTFKNLGFIVTDEQHRFGVNQRGKLAEKGDAPHVLVMSATPIPRSLAMIVYGDLDISVLNSVLPGRQKIDTFRITTDKRMRMYGFLSNAISNGEQVYIVCASIEENENDVLDVETCRQMLLDYGFKSEEVCILHGKMRPAEKDFIMKEFIEGKIKVLISTTVIEVGIDVPNATVMVIENAERFGISQLHQLRGRVGRGNKKSYCILVSDSKGKESARRFSAMKNSSDGFYLSQEDLEIRGPGDFFGVSQHGVPNIKMVTKFEDMPIVKKAQEFAGEFFELIDEPEFAKIKEKLEKIKNNDGKIIF